MVDYRNVIRAARDSGVARSVAGSGPDAGPLLAVLPRGQLRVHRAAARRELVPGLDRQGIDLQRLLPRIAGPLPHQRPEPAAADGRISLVSRADVTRCLAPLVMAPASGRHHDITGPESPDLAAIAASAARQWGTLLE